MALVEGTKKKGDATRSRVAELELELEIADIQIELLIEELAAKQVHHAGAHLPNNSGKADTELDTRHSAAVTSAKPSPLRFLPSPAIYLIRRLRRSFISRDRKRQINLLVQSDLFDEQWYLSTYPDVKTSLLCAEEHYLLLGARELRDPSPRFSAQEFIYRNPHVRHEGLNPLLEHLRQSQ